jgi:tRNA(fMet)-specific endonuclease VapC
VYLLDTNIVSTFLDRRRNSQILTRRILSQPPENLFINIVTIEEMMQGELGSINRLRHKPRVVVAYQGFEALFSALNRFQIVSYTDEIDRTYRSMTLEQKRVGTQDCRIAATAIALGMTVVTANVTDFRKIGTVVIEDWTVDSTANR